MKLGYMERPPLDLSVIVPAFNEAANLEASVRLLQTALDALRIKAEIIIVNDGSTDGTASIADTLSRELSNVTAHHQSNQGIGGAFRAGAACAVGEYLILWPADMPAEVGDLEPYARQLGGADVIVGVRRARIGYNPLMQLNSWVYPKLTRLLFDLRLRDVNWIHAYRRSLFLKIRLTQRGIPMLVEALVRLRDAGATLVEVDVEMKARTTGVPSASRYRVMWRTIRGLVALWWDWRKHADRG
jgi:glycosyltransferase involved in cell wall biosynthesis